MSDTGSTTPRIAVLGGGPAGLGAAYRLARDGKARVVLFERGNAVGGNAGSFELAGLRVDYGSHRLHPACDPSVLADIRAMLGEELLDRPRHGRIRLQGRWIHFPLRPLDLLLRLPPSFAARVARDLIAKPLRSAVTAQADEQSFSSLLEASLGPTIARDFYIPYARKIWGADPDALDAVQARRRVSANSPGKLVRKVLSAVPGFKPPGAGRFFYPRGGYGRISEAYAEAAREAGAELRLGVSVREIARREGGGFTVRVERTRSGEADSSAAGLESLDVDRVWSTIPLTVLARTLRPEVPAEVVRACEAMEFRAMLLVYLIVEQERFTEYDAHYFPEPSVAVTRISEPKNYALAEAPRGRTVLCAELPCSTEEDRWRMSDAELGRLVAAALEAAGLPLGSAVSEVAVRRLPQAYPVYKRGYQRHFDLIDRHLAGVPGLLSFGRQGLFAHDNTHHALFMAYSAADCLDGARFDDARWEGYRRVFETHVVED